MAEGSGVGQVGMWEGRNGKREGLGSALWAKEEDVAGTLDLAARGKVVRERDSN